MTQPTPEQVQQWYADHWNTEDEGYTGIGCHDYIAQRAFAAGAASMQPEIDELRQRLSAADEVDTSLCKRINELEAQLAALRKQPKVNAEEIQWRNIRKVVNALADFCFGSQDDPQWGVSHLVIRTSLTAKDGLDVSTLGLEPLYTAKEQS